MANARKKFSELPHQKFSPEEIKKFPPAVKKAYDALVEARNKVEPFKDAFEAAFTKTATVPEGKVLRFGYMFGGLAVAVDDAPKARAAQGIKLIG
jgi:hypothetical protein